MFWLLVFFHHLRQWVIPLRTSFTLAILFKQRVLLKLRHAHIEITHFLNLYASSSQKSSFFAETVAQICVARFRSFFIFLLTVWSESYVFTSPAALPMAAFAQRVIAAEFGRWTNSAVDSSIGGLDLIGGGLCAGFANMRNWRTRARVRSLIMEIAGKLFAVYFCWRKW